MIETIIDISNLNDDVIGQLKYAAYFIDESIDDVCAEDGKLIIKHSSTKGELDIIQKVDKLIARFTNGEFGFKENIIFENRVDQTYKENIISELIEKKIIKELDLGLYTFREPFTTMLNFFDHYFTKRIGKAFDAKEEYYPVIISGKTLDKTNHFTSFPEHLNFVTHLREDLDIIEKFAEDIRIAGGWKVEEVTGICEKMVTPNYTINPATCYHCYEGMQGEQIDSDGVVVTAVSKVHRHESKNHRDFGRLLDFTMREIIFVGNPEFVKSNRFKSIDILKEIIKEWEIDCTIENANDPFFTNDFQVKASFQRNQEMKFEMRMSVPYLGKTLAVASSNFHSNTFGKAFDIKAGKRSALTGCLAFGLERWVFAFFAQYGLEESNWPKKLVADLNEWREKYV